MFKSTVLTFGLLVASNAYSYCLQDTLEIGDVGPDSQLVCDTLASIYPDKHIEVIGREIRSHDNVRILLVIEEQEGSLDYRLVGADWKLSQSRIAVRY